MIYVIPPLITLTIGYLTLRLILRRSAPPIILALFLGASLGMGISAFIVFSSLVIFGKLVAGYAIVLHLIILGALSFLTGTRLPTGQRFPLNEWKCSDTIALGTLTVFIMPVVIYASFFPQGGWDAWSCWNLKARFIFLGGDNWQHLFDPLLWRSNIAYPLLLPSLNAWSWCFGKEPIWGVTMANSCLITFVTMGTLLFAIKKLSGRLHAILAPLWLLSTMFLIQLSASQYSDLMVGNYFLMAVIAFLYFERTKAPAWLVIMATALGFLSFTKSEGLVLTLITIVTATGLYALTAKDKKSLRQNALIFFGSLVIALLPTILFQLVYAPPQSHTFINGFASTTKPTSFERLLAVFVYFKSEILSGKWNYFWLITLAGLVFSWGKCFKKGLLIIPLTILAYLLAVTGVYWMNTFFEIIWWLSTTLNRILFALIPTIVLWVFLALE